MENYVTDWFRIGQSGKTVDGRSVSPKAIEEMAASYDVNQYRAMIWPEHDRLQNYGEVVALKATDNSEFGKTLWAKLSPNDFYLSDNRFRQKVSFSMEIASNYRDTEKAYLTGLGATDSPASAGTDVIKLSVAFKEKAGVEFSDYTETLKLEKDSSTTFAKCLSALFNKPIFEKHTQQSKEDDMTKEQFEELQGGLEKLSKSQESFAKTDDVTKLNNSVADLSTKLTEANTKAAEFKTALDELTSKYTALEVKLTEALKEQDGTDGGNNTGGDGEFNQEDYI